MPTYTKINRVDIDKEEEDKKNNIFRRLQNWINGRGFFDKEVITASDERVLTGYEGTKKPGDLNATSGSVESKLQKDYDVHLIDKYREFEEMEHTAEVAAALDIIADECVQTGDNGHVIEIKTTNERVKQELENLFFKILKIDNDCWEKVRGMLQFGNRFEEIVINKKDPGVLYLNYIDPSTIRRNETKGRLVNFSKVHYKEETFQVTTYPTANEKEEANTLQAFRIAHFRIENARFRPYGQSVLESSRRTVRQLNMMEDAMTTYRYSRASEKRVWTIDCGELSPDEAMAYTMEVKDKLRKKPRFNPKTGEYDMEMNALCISLDTKIKLLDGRDLELKNIITEFNEGKELWTMSVDKDANYHIGKIKWAGVTRRDAEVVKVTLDDGSEHIVTPDHKFIMRNGEKVKAEDLKENDSLIPMYCRYQKNNPKRKNTNNAIYEYYLDLEDNKFKRLFRKVAEEHYNNEDLSDKVVHHKDFNPLNNNPNNLKPMNWKEHSKFHYNYMWKERRDQIIDSRKEFWNSERGAKRKAELSAWTTEQNIKRNSASKMQPYNHSELHKEHNKIRRATMKNRFSDKEYVRKFSESKTMVLDNKIYEMIKEAFINSNQTSNSICDYLNKRPDFFNYLKEINKEKVLCSKLDHVNRHSLLRMIRNQGYENFNEYKNTIVINHKVSKVEKLNYKIDTGCIEVDNEHHNFPILCSIKDDKEKSYVFIKNSITEDFFLPSLQGKANNTVTQLAGASNLGEIDDVLYFKKKLFFALKIPLSMMDNSGVSFSKSNLATVDIRFARFIERLQRFFAKGLEKVAIVHLLLKKFSSEEINSFSINLTPASNIKKLADIEFMTAKFNAVQSAKSLEMFPDIWILTVIYGLSHEEAENLLKMVKIQKAGGEVSAAGGGGGGGGGLMGALGGGPEPTPAGGEALPTEGMPSPEEAGGAEVPGGAGGESPAAAPEGGGGEGGGGEAGGLTASYELEKELMIKNPAAYHIYETIKRDPVERKRVYDEYLKCMQIFIENRKNDKNFDTKKDNITNAYEEFQIFGEMEGIKEYALNLEKKLFEEKKRERIQNGELTNDS
jgi:hypothetical protein